MPRQRLATSVLEARGSFAKHPERVRGPEPVNTLPIGNAPSSFNLEHRDVWIEFVTSAPPGVLSASERILVEMIVRLIVEIRTCDEVKPALFGKLDTLIGKCGMTPADRQRVGVAPPKDANDFDDI